MELLTTTDPLGHVITNTTTAGSDQTDSVDPLGIGTSTSYNALHEPVVITDTQGQRTTTQYNALGDPITITDPLSYTTIMTPAANGLALARTDGNGHTTRYGYDSFGDTIAVTDALGRISTMVYDTHIGRLATMTDPKLQTTTLGYDGEDRLLQTTYQDGSVTKNLIDADGNVTETVDSAGATLFMYDGDNRPIRQTYPDGAVVSYSYDAAGRLQTKSEPGLPTTTYNYDAGGRLKTVTNSLLGQFTYSYDAASRLTALGDPNGITTTYTLDNDNRVTSISEAKGTNTLLGDSFSYLKPGGGMGSQRMAETRNDNGVNAQWSYSYDADARLTGAILAAPLITTVDDGVQDTGLNQFTYTGSWSHCVAPPNGPNCSSSYYDNTGSFDASTRGNDAATITFNGTGVTYYAATGPNLGIATVSVDDGAATNVDLYAIFPVGSAAVYSSPPLVNGPHTLTIRVSGLKNTHSSSVTVMVDRVGISKAGFTYGYDAVGNMTSNNGVAQRYDADNQITAAGAITYTFDPNGNQTGTSQSTLPSWRYDAQNHTSGYNDSLTSATFTVDGGMQRRQKTVTTAGTTTSGVFDGDMYRQLAPVSRTLYYVRDPGGRPGSVKSRCRGG